MAEVPENSNHNKNDKNLEESKAKEYISIEDINEFTKKVRITSPRSIKAMNNLGINNQDLEYLTYQEYLNKNLGLIGESNRMKKVIYEHIENIRKGLINQVRAAREKIIMEDKQTRKRSLSSKNRKTMDLSNKSKTVNSLKFSEKDLKAFKRMKNINKTNLFNRMELELKKELKNIINNEQEEKQNELKKRNARKLEKKIRIESKKRMTEEEEKEKLAKEIDKKQRKEEEKRIENLIKEEEDEIIRKHHIQLAEEDQKKDGKKKQEMYKQKLHKLRFLEHQAILEKNQQKQTKVNRNLIKLMKERKRKRLNSEINFKNRMRKVEENKRKLEEDIELNNQLLLYKQKAQQQKREKEEARKNKEFKLYQKRLISQGMNEDWQTLLKTKTLNNDQIWEIFNKTHFFNEKEKKQKETLMKNEILINKRKENIMNKINEKGRNIERSQNEKDYYNLVKSEQNILKKLDKDNKVKLYTQYLINKREDLREDLNERDKRIENFMKNKVNVIHKKKDIYEKITKEKDLDNEKFERIMNKKSFDKKSFNYFRQIFPENEKVDEIINEINLHLEKNGNSRYINN
jgi:hypothetical protein